MSGSASLEMSLEKITSLQKYIFSITRFFSVGLLVVGVFSSFKYFFSQVLVKLEGGIGLSLVNKVPEELIFASLTRINIHYTQLSTSQVLELSVQDIQVFAILKKICSWVSCSFCCHNRFEKGLELLLRFQFLNIIEVLISINVSFSLFSA